ncbi:MAG: hypothetical protein IID40_11335 [Planctomycetes bacterium]|nr:hypothetical protein [Planctomycetota bacterium]
MELHCDPFSNIKEPECLVKWQLKKLDTMVKAYLSTVEMYRRLAPLQERMFKHMERELDDVDETDAWKFGSGDDDDEEDDSDPGGVGGGGRSSNSSD